MPKNFLQAEKDKKPILFMQGDHCSTRLSDISFKG